MSKYDALSVNSILGEFMAQMAATTTVSTGLPIAEYAEQVIFNGDIKLFPQQRAVLRAFYNEPLDQQDIDILSQWKEEGRTTWVHGRAYTSMALEGGRRSSKTSITSIIILKEFDDLIRLSNPSQHYGLLPSDPIAIFVFSQTLDQVEETLFGKLSGWAKYSNYFSRLGQAGKIEFLRQTFRCDSKNVGVYAKHTNTDALVGYSLKLMVLDEVARFHTNAKGQNTGDLLWQNVGAATSTFKEVGRKIAISSAWCKGDNIERLYTLSELDPTLLGFRLRTWDLNPNMSRTDPIVVSFYTEDAAKARLEWEGIRTDSNAATFMPDLKPLTIGTSAIDAVQTDLDITVAGLTRHYVGLDILRLEANNKLDTYGHVDYGVKRDAAAFAFCHPYLMADKQWGICVDGYLRWAPYRDSQGQLRTVNFDNVERALILVSKTRGMRHLTFDQYQSTSSIQKLHLEGIITDEASTSLDQQHDYFLTFRLLALAGRITLPKDSLWTPDADAELSELVPVRKGEKVKFTHPTNNKDLADAIVNCVYRCHQAMVSGGMMLPNQGVVKLIKTNSPSIASSNANRQILTPKSLGVGKYLRRLRGK